MAMLSNMDTVPFPAFTQTYSAKHQCSLWRRAVKNYRPLCKNTGAWQKLESQFLLFLPVFIIFIPHCEFLTTIFCTSTEQKTQQCFCSICGSPQRESGQVNQVLLFVCVSFLHHPGPFLFLILRDKYTLVATPQH